MRLPNRGLKSIKLNSAKAGADWRFTTADARIKSGMTANVRIISATRQAALVVPQDAVITRGSDSFVLLDIGGRTQEQMVKLGLVGEDGNVEVLDGLHEGDQIANFGK